MGIFSSSKARTTTNETVANNVDNRVTEGDKVSVGGNVALTSGGPVDNVSISTTDFGALDVAEEITSGALDLVFNTSQRASDIASSALDVAESASSDSLNVAKTIGADQNAETVKTLVIVAGVVALAFVLKDPIKKVLS